MDKELKEGTTLLVGGNGLLGSGLVPLLSKEIKKVTILEGVLPGQKNLIPKGVNEVIFLAQSAGLRSPKMTEDLFFVNTALLMQILQESVDRGVNCFAYCSTGSVYVPSDTAHNEEGPLLSSNLSPYVATKRASEILLEAWRPFFNRLVIFRPFFNYGPGQNSDRLIPTMFRRVIQGEQIYLRNGNGLVFNPLDVDDATRFILHALRLKDGFDIYNIAGNEIVTLFDIVAEIASIVNRKPRFVYQDGKEDIILGDTTKMKSTGFKQKIGIKSGLKETFKSLPKEITENIK